MTKLKISTIDEDKPISLKLKIPAGVHRDLVAYCEALKREHGQQIDPENIVAPKLARFMATDRGFRKARKLPDNK